MSAKILKFPPIGHNSAGNLNDGSGVTATVRSLRNGSVTAWSELTPELRGVRRVLTQYGVGYGVRLHNACTGDNMRNLWNAVAHHVTLQAGCGLIERLKKADKGWCEKVYHVMSHADIPRNERAAFCRELVHVRDSRQMTTYQVFDILRCGAESTVHAGDACEACVFEFIDRTITFMADPSGRYRFAEEIVNRCEYRAKLFKEEHKPAS